MSFSLEFYDVFGVSLQLYERLYVYVCCLSDSISVRCVPEVNMFMITVFSSGS